MQKETVRQLVDTVFSRAGNRVARADLIRRTFGPHVPGAARSESRMSVSLRLVPMTPPKGKSANESGPVLDRGLHLALAESPDIRPQANDLLQVESEAFVLTQVVPLDHGANILFELWYQ